MKHIFVLATLACIGLVRAAYGDQTLVDSDFSKGDFASLGWKAEGAWDVFTYPTPAAKKTGAVARFRARQPNGTLTRTFDEVRNPPSLTLSLDYGWGWGDAVQPADSVSFLLLDSKGSGYAFKFHRCKANWAVQWGRTTDGAAPKNFTWAPVEIDGARASVRDGGGLGRVSIRRQSDGSWTIHGADWNRGRGAAVRFSDAATGSFSRIVLLGAENFDEPAFNRVVLTVGGREPVAVRATPTATFLDSVGVVTSFPDRGQPLPKTVEMVKFCGFRWVRAGIEGVSADGPTTLRTFLDLHRQTGVRFSWGLVSGGADLTKLLDTARPLHEAGALLAFEGNNEPNNWGVTYRGERGGGDAPTWLPVARLQRDLYRAVRSDPALKKYPVWSISEAGGQRDNMGLQFLAIPAGAGASMPEGTQYADFVNVHNYIYHPSSAAVEDNKTWNAADPTSACRVDGLFGNHGVTWAGRFRGYSEDELLTLPRVTTETGATVGGDITEDIHARNLTNLYLSQFKRGWRHTAVYLLRDRTDEGGNQQFGLYRPDYAPRKAAVLLHNLTAILADKGTIAQPGQLSYALPEQPATVHDLLLQKSDGAFQLVVWGERVRGTDPVTVRLARKADVKIYDVTEGTTPVRTAAAVDSVPLTVGDHALVLEIADRP